MLQENSDLTPQEMADKMFYDVYDLLPDSTEWYPNDLIFDLTRKIVVSVISNTMDSHLWNEKKFFYWEQVMDCVKEINTK